MFLSRRMTISSIAATISASVAQGGVDITISLSHAGEGCLEANESAADAIGPISASAGDVCSYVSGQCPGAVFNQNGDGSGWAMLGHAGSACNVGATNAACFWSTRPSAIVHAVFTIEDLVISGPPAPSVVGSVNLSFDIALTVAHNLAALNHAVDAAAGFLCVANGQPCANANLFLHGENAYENAHTDALPSYSFGNGSAAAGGLFTTGNVTLPVGTPFQIQVVPTAAGSTDLNGPQVQGGAALAAINVSLAYASTIPVLNLPQGYTANSASANIVDNHWVFDDCNGNGTPDTADIAGGASLDVNGNAVPDECECLWDLDGSGDVGITDLFMMFGAWGANPGHVADLNGDGFVGITDLFMMFGAWGACP